MTPPPASVSPVTLDPDYRLCTAIFLLSIPFSLVSIWITGVMSLFAIFLATQTATLRLTFTDAALEIYRGHQRIRLFPYQDWLHWEIYQPAVPVLLYFREVKSIHFLPILFNPKQLQQALETHVGSAALLASTPASGSPPAEGISQDPQPQ
jgi:hypothetical protein